MSGRRVARPVRAQAPSNSRTERGAGSKACWRLLAGEGWPSRFERKRPPTVERSGAPDRRPVGGQLCRANGGGAGSRGIRPSTVDSIAGAGAMACWRLLAGEGRPNRFARKRPPTVESGGGARPNACWRLLAGEGWPGRFARKRPPTDESGGGARPNACWRLLAGEGWPSRFARKRPPTVERSGAPDRRPVGGRLCRAKGGRAGSRGIRPPTVDSIAGAGAMACWRLLAGEGRPSRFARKRPPTGGPGQTQARPSRQRAPSR